MAYRISGNIFVNNDASMIANSVEDNTPVGSSTNEYLPKTFTTSETTLPVLGKSSTITGVPSWANVIVVLFNGLSLNDGSDFVLVRLGTSAGDITTGYNSVSESSGSTSSSSTAGFVLRLNNATRDVNGPMYIRRCNSGDTNTTWEQDHAVMIQSALTVSGGGRLTYASSLGAIDRVSIVSTLTGSFDAGAFSLYFQE